MYITGFVFAGAFVSQTLQARELLSVTVVEAPASSSASKEEEPTPQQAGLLKLLQS